MRINVWTLSMVVLALVVAAGCGGKKKKGVLCAGSDCATICADQKCVQLSLCASQDTCTDGTCMSGVCWNQACNTDTPCPYGQCVNNFCVGNQVEIAPSYKSGSENPTTGTTAMDEATCGTLCLKKSGYADGYCSLQPGDGTGQICRCIEPGVDYVGKTYPYKEDCQ